MKKWICILMVMLALCGCSDEELPVLETVGPEACEPASKPEPGQIGVMIPEQAVAQTMTDGGSGQLYTWDGNVLQLQTVDSGDIRRTVTELTGFSYDDLTVMQYAKGDLMYYQTVWSTAGEDGMMLGRALIADDGNYHYCISLLSPEEADVQNLYDQMCATFSVRSGSEGK